MMFPIYNPAQFKNNIMYLHLVWNRNVYRDSRPRKKWNDDKRGRKGNQKTFWQFLMILSIRSNNNKR